MADGEGEVRGERAAQWAEPSVDEAKKCGMNFQQYREDVVAMYILPES